jgi:tripartite ATP-independent transporter DctM subunit
MSVFLLLLLLCIIIGLLSGFPVAFVLGGGSLLVAFLANAFGMFDVSFLQALPNRIYGIMTSDLLIAVPLFVFMGIMLERSKVAEELLEGMAKAMCKIHAGLGISVVLVGTLLAASTGIVGATVVAMGLISLPTMLKAGYHPRIAAGTICAAGTLGQIIPPSIALILLSDQISSAHQNTQMRLGSLAFSPISIADIFVGALIPGLMLVVAYIAWLVIYGMLWPENTPCPKKRRKDTLSLSELFRTLLPPLMLIVAVLGSILSGMTTATESAAIGAIGAMLLAATRRKLNWENLTHVVHKTAKVTSMIFTILIGATIFSLVFRGFGGDDAVHHLLTHIPGGLLTVMFVTMVAIFLLGFFLDFIEIIFVVVPIVAPILLAMGADPIWLAVMIALNLQTSFLTPPFGFSLFYLRGVASKKVLTSDIYRGVLPFVMIQILVLMMVALFPKVTTWLPEVIYGTDASSIPETLPGSMPATSIIDF